MKGWKGVISNRDRLREVMLLYFLFPSLWLFFSPLSLSLSLSLASSFELRQRKERSRKREARWMNSVKCAGSHENWSANIGQRNIYIYTRVTSFLSRRSYKQVSRNLERNIIEIPSDSIANKKSNGNLSVIPDFSPSFAFISTNGKAETFINERR